MDNLDRGIEARMSGVFQYQSMDTPDRRGSGDAGTSGHSSMGNGRNGNGRMSPSSPLRLFGQAKKNINEIFKDVLDFLSESYSFVEDIEKKNHIEEINCQDHVKVCRERVCGIMEVLCRDASGILQEGFQERLSTFSNFERVFEECLSKSAVRTKFEQHTNRGKSIITDMRNILEKILSASHKQTDDAEKSRREMADELDYMEKQLQLLVTEIKDKIKNMVEDVERKVSSTLNDEIKRLSTLVDKFDRPFHPDDTSLNIYKKELHVYIEESIIENLHKHCSGIIRENKDELDRHMIERLSALLPEEEQQQIQNVLPKRDEFEIAYRLDCRNLCADFQEDIRFQFSLHPRNIFRFMFGRQGFGNAMHHQYDAIPRNIPQTPQEPHNVEQDIENVQILQRLFTYASNIGQKTMIAGLCVGVVIYKAVGWKVLVIGGGVYAFVYGCERLSWTNRAKERRFKGQYVDYASSKLRLIVNLTSDNCSHQVQQELTSTFARLCNHADITKSRLEDEIKQKDINIEQLKIISKKSKAYRNKADLLDKALDTFKETFLSTL